MRRFACARWLFGLALVSIGLVAVAGCAGSAVVLKERVRTLENQQAIASRQNQALQGRLSSLDKDNQEQASLLARARQQSELLQQQLAATRDQLRDVNGQLTEVRKEKESSESKVQALTASMRRRGGVSITPNNSLRRTLPAINLPEVHVRRDGDVIRVELPGGRLFESGSAQLRAGAESLISSAAAELLATYPDHLVGVEGYTDSDPVTGRQWGSNHELSIVRAKAVFDVLVNRTRYQPKNLFIVGHGANHPVVSNATPEGKKRNRRVELVVYPEQSN